MKEIKIQKGVPLPDKKGMHEYPFGDMEVGDSFALPNEDVNLGARLRSRFNNYCSSNRLDWKASIKTSIHEVRIWRIS